MRRLLLASKQRDAPWQRQGTSMEQFSGSRGPRPQVLLGLRSTRCWPSAYWRLKPLQMLLRLPRRLSASSHR